MMSMIILRKLLFRPRTVTFGLLLMYLMQISIGKGHLKFYGLKKKKKTSLPKINMLAVSGKALQRSKELN